MYSSKLINLNVNSFSFITKFLRNSSTKPTTNGEIQPQIFNRNPRNLERLRIAIKPSGYIVDNNKKLDYWHKLEVESSSKFVTAQLFHYTKQLVVYASTKEWALQKHLYSGKDRQAHLTLAKVFAERCLESGIYCFSCDENEVEEGSSMSLFYKVLKEEGLMLSEPPVYNPHHVWKTTREKKPWTVLED